MKISIENKQQVILNRRAATLFTVRVDGVFAGRANTHANATDAHCESLFVEKYYDESPDDSEDDFYY